MGRHHYHRKEINLIATDNTNLVNTAPLNNPPHKTKPLAQEYSWNNIVPADIDSNNIDSNKTTPDKPSTSALTFLVLASLLTITLFTTTAQAKTCDQPVAHAISVQGLAEQLIVENNQQSWEAIHTDHSFCASDVLRVRANSRVALRLINNTVVRLDEHTTISFTNLNTTAPSSLDIKEGIAHFISRVKRAFKVITPFVNAAIEGTEFVVAVDSQQTAVTVFEGKVSTENDLGRILLTKGQTALTRKGQAPILKLQIKPRNAVQWALHYPVVIDPTLAAISQPTTSLSSPPSATTLSLEQSLTLFQQGKTVEALQPVEQLVTLDLNAEAATYRASLWLMTGRIHKAEADIEHALKISNDHSEALALKSIIALMQNQIAQAISLAQKSIDSNKQNPSGYLALSHARQAQFNLTEAQAILAAAPKNARVLSRRAELTLMLGDPESALLLAARAANINPNLSHAQSIIGFTHLIRNNPIAAKIAFDAAARLDQTSPLPQLGLGFVEIRNNRIEHGRQKIEFAASLDPNNALIRSYLGKAYYEENRSKRATDQFDMAKALDPLDPTPWFYSAINKQSENRPVDALHDIKKSTALNNNRAVYRSQQQLDKDTAARNASVARIYRDLGFDQLAMQQAWRSLNSNPANHSAHRFLADTYSSLPRHEIARVSELLQSQLLQPLNSNPVQPQLAESNLGILEGAGPADPSSVELNPLFTRNGLRYQFDTLLGGNKTRGGDALISGINDNVAFSLGHFYYSSDGFRDNNDLEHNISSAFFQSQLNTSLSVQAEHRVQKTETGDLLLNPDPDDFRKFWRQTFEVNTKRLGSHYQPVAGHNIIASYIRRTKNLKILKPGTSSGIITQDSKTISDSSNIVHEIQYLYQNSRFAITAGAGLTDVKRNDITIATGDADITENYDSNNNNAYLYSYLTPSPNLSLTLGLSRVYFKRKNFDIDQFNPKLGINWKVNRNTRVRAAALSMLHRPITSGQTIEPTHVAGFNQFFDDINGTDSNRYGLAIEHNLNSSLSAGFESTRRTLAKPLITISSGLVTLFPVEERINRAYLYQTLNSDWSVTGEYFLEQIVDDSLFSSRVKTHRVPVGLQYHATYRIRAGLTASYYRQNVNDGGVASNDAFWLVDVNTGYRLPKRAGLLTAGVKNLFNQEFSFYSPESPGKPDSLIIQPERSVFAALTLTF